MTLLVVAAQVAAGVLLVAGLAKLASPLLAGTTLLSLAGRDGAGLGQRRAVGRFAGLVEVSVSVAALWVGGRAWAPLAAAYVGLTVVAALALRAGVASCGCFGRRSAPPSRAQVALNAGSAVLAAVVAWSAPATTSLAGAVGEAGWLYPGLSAVAVWLVVSVGTARSEALAAVASVEQVRPVFRRRAGMSA